MLLLLETLLCFSTAFTANLYNAFALPTWKRLADQRDTAATHYETKLLPSESMQCLRILFVAMPPQNFTLLDSTVASHVRSTLHPCVSHQTFAVPLLNFTILRRASAKIHQSRLCFSALGFAIALPTHQHITFAHHIVLRVSSPCFALANLSEALLRLSKSVPSLTLP